MHEQWHIANNGNFQECTAHMQCQLGQITAHIYSKHTQWAKRWCNCAKQKKKPN